MPPLRPLQGSEANMNGPTSPEEMAANRLSLGEFVLDLVAGELYTAGGQLAGLRKQALDVLLALGRRAGEVVSKDELMQLVWPNVVVGEGSLTQAIADIRRVLGDSGHRAIRNVARRGYMLVPDEPPPAPGEAAPMPAAGSPDPPAAAVAFGALRPRQQAALLGALVLAVLLAIGAWLAWRSTLTSWRSPADLARAPLPREVPPLSIIVLPLALEGEATDAEWLADALHGDLVIAVAQLQNSLVIARDTASTYKGKAVDPRQVAREMGVRHVVRGSLRQEGRQDPPQLGADRRRERRAALGRGLRHRACRAGPSGRRLRGGDRAHAGRRALPLDRGAPCDAVADARCRPTTWRCGATRCGIAASRARTCSPHGLCSTVRWRWIRTRRGPGPASTSRPSPC